MTAQAAPAATVTGRSLGELISSMPFRPAEGWLSLFATTAMVLVIAGALIDAGWTGNAAEAGFLPWVGLAGLAFGVAGAKIGWGRWRTHVVGALFAGLILPLIMGGIAIGQGVGWDPPALAHRVVAALDVARNVWIDLVIDGRQITNEINHYYLVFGVLVWGAGMLAGFTVFGHRRPLDAIVVLGLVLLANMALTLEPNFPLLVAFSAAALLLLIRTHVFEQELAWARRRIGDPVAIGQLYLSGGAMFVTGAVLGAILLTATASSAPLQGLWNDLPGRLQSVAAWLQKFAPPGGKFRGLGGVAFGDDAPTTGQWTPSGRIAFRAQLPATEAEPFKWRAGTRTEYYLDGWRWGPTRTETTPARGPLLDDADGGDKPNPTGRREVSFVIRPDAFTESTVLGPNMITSVDRATNTILAGNDGWFTTVEATESLGGSYNVTALIPVFEAQEGGITEPALRTAGTDYPEEVLRLYTQLPDGALGSNATALLAAIRAAVVVPTYASPDNPYDLARTMQDYFRNNSNFQYQADVRSLIQEQCGRGMSTVECFATIRRGYCDYYASTMAVLLRASGVPARIAYGFLPGERRNGVEEVGASLSHYWVEVYFPGIGWIEFDPTGGSVGRPQAIPSGSPIPGTPKPTGPAATPRASANPAATAGPGSGGSGTPDAGAGPFIAIGVILVIGVLALVFAAVRRTPSRPMHPDTAWGSVGRLAARFGLGPRPSQTVYEYAGALGDAVPGVRVELTTIARAKVEVAYGKRDIGSDRLRNVAIAYQRLRFALLGAVLRRRLRRRARRDG